MTKRSRIGLRILQLIFVAAAMSSGSVFAQASGASACQLNSANSKIKHVVELIFDNVHLRRDNPNVPSDLEQMPNLLNFIRQKGTLNPNHHPVLISHTADDELSFLTGVYGDRHGIPSPTVTMFSGPTVAQPSHFRSSIGPILYWIRRPTPGI